MGVYLKWWILATFSVDYPRRNHYYLKKRINLGCNKHYNNRRNKYWIIISCKKILHNSKCVYLFYSCRFYLLPICKNKCELTGTSLVKKILVHKINHINHLLNRRFLRFMTQSYLSIVNLLVMSEVARRTFFVSHHAFGTVFDFVFV